jgi:hypothetical protein
MMAVSLTHLPGRLLQEGFLLLAAEVARLPPGHPAAAVRAVTPEPRLFQQRLGVLPRGLGLPSKHSGQFAHPLRLGE